MNDDDKPRFETHLLHPPLSFEEALARGCHARTMAAAGGQSLIGAWCQLELAHRAISRRTTVLRSYAPSGQVEASTADILAALAELGLWAATRTTSMDGLWIDAIGAETYLRMHLHASGLDEDDDEQAAAPARECRYCSELNFETLDPDTFEALSLMVSKLVKPRVRTSTLYALVRDEDGSFDLYPALRSAGRPLERGNYTPEVLEHYDAIVHDLKSDVPRGRIALLDGPIGTGKTWMIRGIMEACPEIVFLHCPAELVSELDSPTLLPVLLRHRRRSEQPVALVIEDGDACIVSRGSDNMSALRALLGFGDGLLGAAFDMRCIVTTNAGHLTQRGEIDKAVLRPGRLSGRVQMNPLVPVHADGILQRLTGRADHHYVSLDPGDKIPLGHIYELARTKGWDPAPIDAGGRRRRRIPRLRRALP